MSMIPAKHNQEIHRGVTYTFAVTIELRSGAGTTGDPYVYTPVDLSTAAVLFTLKDKPGMTALQASVGDGVTVTGDDNNRIHVQLSEAETVALELGLYQWTLDATVAGVTTRYFEGVMKVSGY